MARELTAEEEQTVTDLRAQHKRIAYYLLPGGELVVIRKCKPAECTRFMDKVGRRDHETMGTTLKELGLSVIVHPDPVTAKPLIDEYPALYGKFAKAAYDLAGGDIEELGKD